MFTKDVIVGLTDIDTSEIIRTQKQTMVVGSPQFEKFVRMWFDCFLRGLKQDKNLYFSISVKDWNNPCPQLDLF